MSEQAPRPALDAATERRLTDLVNDYGTAQYRLGSRDTKGAAWRGDIEAYGRARLALLDALFATAAERDALAGEAARYRAALGEIERVAAAIVAEYERKIEGRA